VKLADANFTFSCLPVRPAHRSIDPVDCTIVCHFKYPIIAHLISKE